MKSITVYFEDQDFEDLSKLKGEMTWREFVLQLKEFSELPFKEGRK